MRGQSFGSQREYCIRSIATHEFAHVLAVAHEQNREDGRPAYCGDDPSREGDDGTGDTEYGYWDVTSVSNYCNPAFDGDGLLSPLDIAGLQNLYGQDENDFLWLGIGNVRDYAPPPTPPTPPALPVDTDQMQFITIKQSVGAGYLPLSGDFDGDTIGDIFWYSPSGTDAIWYGNGDGTFTSQTQSVGTGYTPFSGDFDGDGKDDIFWYAPGASTDYIWYGSAARTFTSQTESVGGTFYTAVSDFDGDGIDDILWNGSSSDYIWLMQPTRGSKTSTNTRFDVAARPLAGDFDGDGFGDIFWYGQ